MRALSLLTLLLILPAPALAGVAFLSDAQIPLNSSPSCAPMNDTTYAGIWAAHVANSIADKYSAIARIHDAGDVVEACTGPVATNEYRKYLNIMGTIDSAIKVSNFGDPCCPQELCMPMPVCYRANTNLLQAVPGNHNDRVRDLFNDVFS